MFATMAQPNFREPVQFAFGVSAEALAEASGHSFLGFRALPSAPSGVSVTLTATLMPRSGRSMPAEISAKKLDPFNGPRIDTLPVAVDTPGSPCPTALNADTV